MRRIEITQPVIVEASCSFWIDKDEWEAADDDTRRAIVGAEIDKAQGQFDRTGGSDGLYVSVKSWIPEERVEYDPELEKANEPTA
ncbi:MAG: hypothetical protein EOQ44_25505 [Mesorhizobium sp.]|uniref:hypothetical protein n=1 Tax=Mesorhizobium sp. TaxID=1871066 RepID=UPI000FE7AEF2|nr:hypothetical protein [Mesorhizobium sp.]RWB40497.1 MAG: hypothetical protein EOQ44_25505 [Mesorhizobium sp.]